jgi:S1-C subfamily serine protease
MKSFFLLLSFLSINLSFAQNDYATINIYRGKRLCVGCEFKVYINDFFITKIENGGHLEYKMFTTGVAKIKIIDNGDYSASVTLNAKRNENYYINFIKRAPIKGNRIDIEMLNEPINKTNLIDGRLIRLSDIGVLDDVAKRDKGDTDWTYNKLIEHWTKDGISDIEGIYERVSAQIEYRLAILKEKNEYKIIYLAGAKGTDWKEGDIKATLRKTAQFGIFKSNWIMLNKTYNKDINVIFETASMKTLSEAGENSQDLYLKMYPTYDESENSKIVSQNSNNWKSSGTGFFIDKKGYIATNHHVIDKAKNIQVEINRNSYNADVVIYDEQNDLAILKINDNTFIPLQNLQYNFKSETSDVGTSVFALGFPLTSLLGEEIKYTTGAISSKSGMKGDITTYQISVPIQPGNSGGPLFDNDGNLIGITSSGINRKLNLTENVNYAIKTKYLKLLIDEMNEKIQLPNLIFPKNILLTKKIKSLEKGVVLIKVK